MKTLFTLKYAGFRIAILSLAMIQISLYGISQTTHQVAVTDHVFTPANLTINVGDKIVWTNTEGNHNVNATQSSFPSNPESFGNNVGAGWTFEHTFNTAGSYNYQCDPHVASGMVGTVEVVDISTNIDIVSSTNSDWIKIYPNPTDAYLNISITDNNYQLNSYSIYSVTGTLVLSNTFNENSGSILDLSHLNSGYYIIELQGEYLKERFKILKQ